MSDEIILKLVHSLSELQESEWNACANPPGKRPYNPFVDYRFLNALEESGSACAESGWAPCHLVLEADDGSLRGVVPLYLKSHSSGEYVFDHSWAHAFERAGGDYYPKLQSSVPFTPASGPRLLARDPGDGETEAQLLAGCMEAATKLGVSSLHMTFMLEGQAATAEQMGFLLRNDQQFHWINEDFKTFDDFLATLASRKRKNLKKERAAAIANDIEIEWVTGADLSEDHWDAFFHFYVDTGHRKWGSPYLTREFFSLINERMADQTLLIMCKRDGRYIAGALNFIGEDCLYGRHWGAIEDHRFLHFEACYYQAIDFAIDRGLARVEAGAQGQHKLARGYMPTKTYSAHWIQDPGFRTAVEQFLDDERRYVDREIDALSDMSPFRKTQSDD